MKLADHVELIRQLIDTAFRNRLGRMGIAKDALQPMEAVPVEYHADRTRMETIREVWIAETGTPAEAFEKLVEEFTFTLFNRLAALKVMEAHTLHPEIVTRRAQHGDRSFAQKHWLEQHPEGRNEEMEGLVRFLEDQLAVLAADIPLFSLQHPYHLLPTAIELNGILQAFNQVETDEQVDDHIWQSDDVLGWLYESFNNFKKAAHKESGDKTEFNKVSIQSQVYTPKWVVKFLVDNSLGKMYLEMYPDSDIKNRYKIANAPKIRTRAPKPLHACKLIDPACGSGNFLLYAFDLFYDLYTDQIENYGADYDDRKIAEQIIAHNLHGVDIDDRAIQLAQLGLYIKAKRKKRTARIEQFNIVSSDFMLPDFDFVLPIFRKDIADHKQLELVESIWTDLQAAHKFGSLVRLSEKVDAYVSAIRNSDGRLFSQEEAATTRQFKEGFLKNLAFAFERFASQQPNSFLATKTQDANTFLKLITHQYDVAVANPPYTDSGDFGPELKKFVEANYKQPYKFNSNLYATFIKRCYELIDEKGKMALIHPLTFMYIKTFEDVRKFIIDHTHISVFVDYGLSNLFGTVMVDPAFYVLEKEIKKEGSWFISLDQYTRTPNEKFKKDFCLEALEDHITNHPNKHNITLPQEKLKIIEGWPFIYWISDGFREKFREKALDDVLNPRQGLASGNNDRCLRYWWEINFDEISFFLTDNKNWKNYTKGGPFNKWYGNNWIVIDYSPSGYNFLLNNGNHLPSRSFYFKKGITYAKAGSKGASFRLLPENSIFDSGSPGIFPGSYEDTSYVIAFLNSELVFYILECLNPTVSTQVGDIKRIPFVLPSKECEIVVSILANQNIEIKRSLCSYRIIETNFHQNPLLAFSGASLQERLLAYLNFENAQLTQVLLNEAVINELIFKVYELSDEDRQQVEAKMGVPVGQLGIGEAEKHIFKEAINNGDIALHSAVLEHLNQLPVIDMEADRKQQIISEFPSLYQSNNDLEEFCITHQVNPINVWCWFRESRVLPTARAAEVALEFLADAFRSILMADADGIVPLVGLPGEPRLLDRFEEYCFSKGFTTAQIMQLEGLLGRPVNEYIEQYFFRHFSDHLNLFMYLPKTPFIWHLSSGEYQGFEAFIIIYKWNRDSLYKLKSTYLSKRTESLQYRLQQLAASQTGQAQTEKETIRLQLQEIEAFAAKIDELIASGYDPQLDDGVGKNIAPLQAKGMLKAEVLKSAGKNSQLQKYLNADW
jgi:type I restriction-modification system DNA methylase subunit